MATKGLGGLETNGVLLWPVATKLADVLASKRKRENGNGGAERRRNKFITLANTRRGRLAWSEATGSDEVHSHDVGDGEAAESIAIEVDGWLREAGKEIGINVGQASYDIPKCRSRRMGLLGKAGRGRCVRQR